MLGILSLTIFSPLVGVAAILLLRLTGSPARQPAIDSAATWRVSFIAATIRVAGQRQSS